MIDSKQADLRARAVDWLAAPGLSAPVLAIVCVAAAATWLYAHHPLPWEPWSVDALEFVLLARRLAGGEGFTTPVIFPLELGFGSGPDHPSLLRAPLWPLVVAAAFALAGPVGAAAHAAVMAAFVATAAATAWLAASLSNRGAGLVAGLAAASSPQLLIFSLDATSETLFAASLALCFALCARRAHPFWIGVVCGLAYLTRLNGAVLSPAVGVWLLLGPRPIRSAIWAAAGFIAVASPWWIRNTLVTGNPLNTIYNWVPYGAPDVMRPNTFIHFEIEPSLDSPVAIAPLEKARILLPVLLRHFPYAGASLGAFAGLVLACVRRDRLSLVFALFAAATLVAILFALPNGRYFAPLVAPMLGIGVAGWLRYGGRLAPLGLALVLATPLLPAIPAELPDVVRFRSAWAAAREGLAFAPGKGPRLDREALERCFAGRPVVLAEDAARIAWWTDAIALHLPRTGEDFWRIVDEHPVRFLQLRHWKRVEREALLARFEPRPECGPFVYAPRR